MNSTDTARILAINFDDNSERALLGLYRESCVEILFSGLVDFLGGAYVDHPPFDVVLLNLSHHADHLLKMIPAIRRSFPGTEIVLLSPTANEHLWNQALNLGAYDLLPIPAEKDEFLRVISGAICLVKPAFPALQPAAVLGAP